ncbi:hypothetical protein H8E07_19390 [bacterium]|nr:hypothetical protein [bacterium]
MSAPATDHRTEGLRALARLIADAVTPVPDEPPGQEPELEHQRRRQGQRGPATARDGPAHLGVVQ